MKLKTAFISSQVALLISFIVVLTCGAIIYQKVANHYRITQSLTDFKQVLSDTVNLQQEFSLDKDEQMLEWSKEQFDDYSQLHFALFKQVADIEIAARLLTQIQES